MADPNIKSKLAVAYTRATELHVDERGDKWECPDRTKQIFNILETSGILSEATRLEGERAASTEDFYRVHTPKLMDQLEKYRIKAEQLKKVDNEPKEDRQKRLAHNRRLYNDKTLILNEHSISSAFLGAGCVLSAVDFVLANNGVAFALPRPGMCPTLSGLHCSPCIVSCEQR